ncbi:MAG: TerB family tellurite resistance protein [Bacteroidales bacterium]|nr:TerB family tellurite resistance protein [Bacteroidales bacterium]
MNRENNGCLPLFCALIGMLILGPIGSIIGFLLGSAFNMKKKADISDSVLRAIATLFAALMKADNRIMKSELYSYRDILLQHFGPEAAGKALDYLSELKDKDIQIQEPIALLNLKLNYTERLEILRYLFQLAYADGDISANEMEVIRRTAVYFQIRTSDYEYLRNSYSYYYQWQQQYRSSGYQSGGYQSGGGSGRVRDTDADYALLGVQRSDSDETIKKAYRRLAIDNHPDKVAHLGEAARKEAEARFARINEAYQRIKDARGIS